MFKQKINYNKLHGRLREILKEQKKIIKTNKKYRTSYLFEGLSREMTLLCCVLAHSKDRLHMTKLTKKFGVYGFAAEIENFTLEVQEKWLTGYYLNKQIEKYFVIEEEELVA